MYTNILIATDGSSLASHAVDQGLKLAKALGAKVCFLTVSERFHVFSLDADQLEETSATFSHHMKEQALRTLSEAGAMAEAIGVDAAKVHSEDDEPYQAIIRTAEVRRCDLIVMASHGRRGVSALLLGSETMKVLTHSKIPVLVVR
ncbi:universal stress protein [Microvirga alba]|uniref:Universal stress protein n=1 Tax=Microvirga alba TaxID=2791025 RepID=A0A931BNS7_9HYPH|nr:universal stress protein [Microvirga alba]MBF9232665.1 universal stress protein [Microvirga alba]